MSEPFNWKRNLPMTVGSFALFWGADALFDALLWRRSLAAEFFTPDRRELCMRLFCSLTFALLLPALALLLGRRRRLKAELANAADLTRTFFHSAADAVCIIAVDGLVVLDANQSFLDCYGLTGCSPVGASLPELIGSRQLPEELVVQLAETAGSGAATRQELALSAEDGGLRYLEISIQPVLAPEGAIERILHVSRDVTAQRSSQLLLQESEARYRAIFDHTGTAMAIVRADGILHMVNRGFEAATGFDREELEGHLPLTRFVAEPDRAGLLMRMAARGGAQPDPQPFELQLIDWMGAARTMAANWASIADSDHAVLSLVDIGRQKRVEEALRESRASLAIAQRIARLGNWEWDLITDRLSWSEEMFRIHGLEPGEIQPTQEWMLQSVHPHDREQVVRALNDAIYNKKPYHLDYHIVIAGSLSRSISARGEVTYDAQGNPLRMIGINQDVTWREEAEQALRRSEEKFSKAFHASPDAIVISRVDNGTYIDVNDAFLEHTGYNREEVIGKTSGELQIWADTNARMVVLQLLNRYGHVRNHDVSFRMKSGELRQLLWSADIIEYQDEACLIAVSKDVTDQRQLERELLQSEARLYMKHEELIRLFNQMEGIRREWEETMDCLSDMFIVADELGRIRRFNRALETFTGKTHRDIAGKECLSFLEEHGLKRHLETPGVELLHQETGRWFALKRFAFRSLELEGGTREVVIINDASQARLHRPPADGFHS
jgi:PAS domain S-box-containing protein